MDLVQIHLQLAEALAGAGVIVYDHPADSMELPAAFLGFPRPIEFDKSYAGGVSLEGEVFVLVARAEARDATLSLASACSTTDASSSVAAAIESGDPTGIVIAPIKPLIEGHDPGGAWKSIHVYEIDGYGAYDVGAVKGLGAVFRYRLSVNGAT